MALPTSEELLVQPSPSSHYTGDTSRDPVPSVRCESLVDFDDPEEDMEHSEFMDSVHSYVNKDNGIISAEELLEQPPPSSHYTGDTSWDPVSSVGSESLEEFDDPEEDMKHSEFMDSVHSYVNKDNGIISAEELLEQPSPSSIYNGDTSWEPVPSVGSESLEEFDDPEEDMKHSEFMDSVHSYVNNNNGIITAEELLEQPSPSSIYNGDTSWEPVPSVGSESLEEFDDPEEDMKHSEFMDSVHSYVNNDNGIISAEELLEQPSPSSIYNGDTSWEPMPSVDWKDFHDLEKDTEHSDFMDSVHYYVYEDNVNISAVSFTI